MKNYVKFGVFILVVLVGFGYLAREHILLNVSDSLPPGLYLLKSSKDLMRGNLITFCPDIDAKTAEYVTSTDKMLKEFRRCKEEVMTFTKPIVAIEGDTVTITKTHILIQGKKYAKIMRSNKNIPQLKPGNYKVQPDTVWTVSLYNPRSFDSRYFGAVSLDRVIGNAEPLWVSHKKPFCYSIKQETKCI